MTNTPAQQAAQAHDALKRGTRVSTKLTNEQEQEIAEFIKRLTAFTNGESNVCLHCGQVAKALSKQGHCVYAEPCGCRQYQGEIPKGWVKRGERGNWYGYVGEPPAQGAEGERTG